NVPANIQLLVQFNRAVATLTQLSSQPEGTVLVIQPALAGHGEWLNTSLYRFVPDEGAVAPFTRYTITVPTELSPEPDGVLRDDSVWSFVSYGPAIDSVTPDVNTKFVGPDQKVSVRFNQAMDRASVEAGFKLTQDDKPVAGAFEWSEADRVVTFSPRDR